MTGPTGGHTLRVSVGPDGLDLGVDCHEPPTADCRTDPDGCLVVEQAAGPTRFDEYYDGASTQPVRDGTYIVAEWSAAEECYLWRVGGAS